MNNIIILVNDVYDKPSKAEYFKTTDIEKLCELAENHNAFVDYLKALNKEAFVLQETLECTISPCDHKYIAKTNILLRIISEVMPVYVECIYNSSLVDENMVFIGYQNQNQIIRLPRIYGQTRRTFGYKEAAMKRLLYFYNESFQEQDEEDDCIMQTINSIDNIGSNECLIYLYFNQKHPNQYCFEKEMKHSYNYIAEDIDLIATDVETENRHEGCDFLSIILYIPVDISNIKVGREINYETFEHLETECSLEMESINNGAGVGKEVFSFRGDQFGLNEDVVFMLTSANEHTYFYKRIN